MDILIGDLVNKIKQIFDKTKVLSVESVYEKINNSNNLKIVISLNRVLYNNVNVIYTKFIFICNAEKTKIIKNHFDYLFDIKCEYVRVFFNDLLDFNDKMVDIFKNNKFGDNIIILSKFINSPSTLINTWFKSNNISEISITNVDFEKINIVPCESLSFNFIIHLNNNQKINLNLDKHENYVFKFTLNNEETIEKRSSLNRLIETIGNMIKNKFEIK